MALLVLLRRMGRTDIVPHDFRTPRSRRRANPDANGGVRA